VGIFDVPSLFQGYFAINVGLAINGLFQG